MLEVGRVLSKVPETVLKPFAKKALESGISHAGDKLGKKAAKKSGELMLLSSCFGLLNNQ